MIWNTLSKYQDVGLLIIRLGLGLGFLFFHGWEKLIGGPERWEGLGNAMGVFGITFAPTFWGFMAAFSESVGGLLIAAGLFFRPICAMLAFTMFVASARHIITGEGSAAHSLKYMIMLAGLVFVSPGKYSVDAWLSRRK